jgi:hypothetical protein
MTREWLQTVTFPRESGCLLMLKAGFLGVIVSFFFCSFVEVVYYDKYYLWGT